MFKAIFTAEFFSVTENNILIRCKDAQRVYCKFCGQYEQNTGLNLNFIKNILKKSVNEQAVGLKYFVLITLSIMQLCRSKFRNLFKYLKMQRNQHFRSEDLNDLFLFHLYIFKLQLLNILPLSNISNFSLYICSILSRKSAGNSSEFNF